MNNSVFFEVQNFIQENLAWVEKDEIKKETLLKDLGLDSIQMMVLIVNCEERFKVTFSEDILENNFFDTVGSIVDYIEKLIGGESVVTDLVER